MKNTGWGQISIFHILERMCSPVVITRLLDYISDLTGMQILISKVTAASSTQAPLPTQTGVEYCFMSPALWRCVLITPAETGELLKKRFWVFIKSSTSENHPFGNAHVVAEGKCSVVMSVATAGHIMRNIGGFLLQ